jgi:hypothetical protein
VEWRPGSIMCMVHWCNAAAARSADDDCFCSFPGIDALVVIAGYQVVLHWAELSKQASCGYEPTHRPLLPHVFLLPFSPQKFPISPLLIISQPGAPAMGL